METFWYILLFSSVIVLYVDTNLVNYKISGYVFGNVIKVMRTIEIQKYLPNIKLSMSPETRKATIYAVAIVLSAAMLSFAYLYSNRYSHVKGSWYYDKWKNQIINKSQ